MFSAQRVASYAAALDGRELASRVIDRLNLELTPQELIRAVEGEAVPDTVLLRISVLDPDPELAHEINEAYGAELAGLVADLETPPGRDEPILKATIIDPSSVPTEPVSPNVVRNLALALLFGLVTGVGIAALREFLDTTVKDHEAVSKALGVAVTGRIGLDKQYAKHPLISQLGSHDPRSEAFRMLRTNLQYVDVDGSNKAYVISSSLPGEGKSSTATNLAISIAQAGKRVLLVDADLRKPRAAALLGADPSVGLTTVLVGKVSLQDAIQRNGSGVDILASGHLPPNPAELLQSNAMETLIQRLRGAYDYVLIDSPPLLPVTDAALLARITDGALLVIRYSKTTRDQLRHAGDQLAQVGATALGVVLNMVPERQGGYGAGYGYYGYGYGGPEPTKRRWYRRRATKPSATAPVVASTGKRRSP